MLVSAGVHLLDGLDLLHRQCDDPRLKECLGQVYERVQAGHRLSIALSAHPEYFGPVFVAMVALGEQVGGLSLALLKLASWLERDQRIAMRWRSALMYPLFVLGVSALLTFLMFYFVVPTFVEVFDSFRAPLPWITRAMLWVAQQLHSPLFLLLFAFLAVELYRQLRLQWRRRNAGWVRVLRTLPGLGPLYQAATLGRLCLALQLTLSMGVPLLNAWFLAATVSGCPLLQQDAQRVTQCCKDGETLTEALEVSPLYPSNLCELVRAGEESAQLATLLARAGDYYDQELDHRIAVFTALLEPLLLSALALLVMGIVLALMLPLYSMIQLAIGS